MDHVTDEMIAEMMGVEPISKAEFCVHYVNGKQIIEPGPLYKQYTTSDAAQDVVRWIVEQGVDVLNAFRNRIRTGEYPPWLDGLLATLNKSAMPLMRRGRKLINDIQDTYEGW